VLGDNLAGFDDIFVASIRSEVIQVSNGGFRDGPHCLPGKKALWPVIKTFG
jgi:hypothetical protein